MKVINLFGGPGCGKSTTAAGLFYKLKMQQIFKVELVREYAKDLVYQGTLDKALPAELLIEQYKRQKILDGQVDLIITDSPVLLPLFYDVDAVVESMSARLFREFDNMNFLLRRSKEYEPYGRVQTLEQACDIDWGIKVFLRHNSIPFESIPYDEAVDIIFERVQEIMQ
ncbi:MAG: ATP-binding protein [Proteobacteria bacterium]|nr:ATP-binding protein [Pseudomonadota bacterium]MBU4576009.1 ATP-binding protein [Pseudomonadota bacterium]MBV1715975.1 ATP-binding protein [Desulfarculus sp.]